MSPFIALGIVAEKHSRWLDEDILASIFSISPLNLKVIDENAYKFVIAFCNTKTRADKLFAALKAKGRRVAMLHGDLRQSERTQILKRFKARELDILVAYKSLYCLGYRSRKAQPLAGLGYIGVYLFDIAAHACKDRQRFFKSSGACNLSDERTCHSDMRGNTKRLQILRARQSRWTLRRSEYSKTIILS